MLHETAQEPFGGKCQVADWRVRRDRSSGSRPQRVIPTPGELTATPSPSRQRLRSNRLVGKVIAANRLVRPCEATDAFGSIAFLESVPGIRISHRVLCARCVPEGNGIFQAFSRVITGVVPQQSSVLEAKARTVSGLSMAGRLVSPAITSLPLGSSLEFAEELDRTPK
jgi:hypothetical protein